MYENFADRYPLPPMTPIQPEQKTYYQFPPERLFAGAAVTGTYNMLGTEVSQGHEYTSWRDECLAHHLTCTVTCGLSKMPTTRISGPDAKAFLKRALVNKMDKFPINTSKHATMVTEQGLVTSDGVIFRLGEDLYEIANCSPYLDYMFFTKGQGLDITTQDMTNTKTVYQLQGPKSLQIVEEALGQDCHDLAFNHIKQTTWNGIEVLVIRFGMGAILGYEVHCYQAECAEMGAAIFEAGRKYGIRRLGWVAYSSSHCPGGSMQVAISANGALGTDEGFVNWMAACQGLDPVMVQFYLRLPSIGSLTEDEYPETLVTPFEMGLGGVVDFDNPDLPGREALLAYKADPKRKMVTLKWNVDDLVDIYRSAFTPGDEEPYEQFDNPRWTYFVNGNNAVEFNRVLDMDGNKIGFSGGRTTDVFNRAMVSFAIMDIAQCEIGNEVQVLWGQPFSRQKLVRAEVVETPFNKHLSNKTFDVESIPRLGE